MPSHPPIRESAIGRTAVGNTGAPAECLEERRPLVLELRVAVHPAAASERLVISYPGLDEPLDGFSGKHGRLMEILRQERGYAILRSENRRRFGYHYPSSVVDDLQCLVEYGIEHRDEIAGGAQDVTLIGYSAGGSAAAVIAPQYLMIDQLVLLAPSGDVGLPRLFGSIGHFRGELTVAVGKQDSPAFQELASRLVEAASAARKKRLFLVEDCSHFFEASNGRDRFEEVLREAFDLKQS